MPNTNKLSIYLKADNLRDGTILTFIDAGEIKNKTFKKDGQDETRPVLEITVEVAGEEKTYSPNGTSVGLLSKVWGPNTEGWVGKKAAVTIIPSGNGKNMIIAKPVTSEDLPDFLNP